MVRLSVPGTFSTWRGASQATPSARGRAD